jgi:hypothetical protein
MANKKKNIKVKPGEPYYSSEELGAGFEQTLPAAVSSAQFREKSPLGALSPRAAIQDAATRGMDLFRGKEGKRGSRFAREVARKVVNKKNKKKMGGGMIKYNKGGKVRGAGIARGVRPAKMIRMKGS